MTIYVLALGALHSNVTLAEAAAAGAGSLLVLPSISLRPWRI